MSTNEETKKIITSPVKAIRLKCLDCMCGVSKEVELCTCPDCSLYPFRFGFNPYHKPRLTDEQRAEKSARMKETRRKQLEAKAQAQNERAGTL